jgi:CRP/FNR family cyclic AMP-dependent transcriptional regulator
MANFLANFLANFQPGNLAWPSRHSAGPLLQAYPGNGEPLKAAKNNPGVLQRYVTYDTLRSGRTPVTPIFELAPESIAMSKQAEFAVILKMNPMFADLGADELQRISALCHTQHLSAGEMLFQKGDPGDALFGVRRGQIRIETGASDGSRLTLNFLGPGDLFGEVAVLDGQSRTADAAAGEPTELFVLRREDFLGHLEREPRVAVKLIMLLCQRIRWMNERTEESVLQPLPVRLARRLCALASDFGSEVHISQEQLGVFVGAARESVNRQLQLWRKDGILDLQRGRILLQNMAKLTAVARNE